MVLKVNPIVLVATFVTYVARLHADNSLFTPQTLEDICKQYAFNASYLRHDSTVAQTLLQSWHSQTERNPVAASVHAQYNRTFHLLIQCGLVDLQHNCPLVDAVHYRNSEAVKAIISAVRAAVLHHDAPVSGFSPTALAYCLTERDMFGQTVLHVAAKSKASGFARLFVRLRQMVAKNLTTVPGAVAVVRPTLELLKLRMLDISEPITFESLNTATQARGGICDAPVFTR